MKTLACLVVLAALAAPAAAQTEKEEDILRSSSALKERFKNARPAPPSAAPSAPPARAPQPAAEAAEGGGGTRTLAGFRPALYMRHAGGAGGLSDEHLADDLDHTARNVVGLINYIRPYRPEIDPPQGEDLDWAVKTLAAESDALPALISAGDAALARGIARGPLRDERTVPPLHAWLSVAAMSYKDPTPTQRLLEQGAMRANVAGHMGALIRLKKENPPLAEDEARAEAWLQKHRRDYGR